MFGMSGTELAIILIVALLLLGPSKLPELARGVGKAVRDFKRATNDIRGTVESEFYRMDQSESGPTAIPPPKPVPPEGAVPSVYSPVTSDPHGEQSSAPSAPPIGPSGQETTTIETSGTPRAVAPVPPPPPQPAAAVPSPAPEASTPAPAPGSSEPKG